ncbi:unnamed protein product [Mytilus coruscus]|uniref:WSC domain-containing protein n=1 Tax=Mytilus coruscus TaxID=42192 RepID=A0A6J8CV46_MYTCO|nr:unnamed protein product [Mytilus coruscus]
MCRKILSIHDKDVDGNESYSTPCIDADGNKSYSTHCVDADGNESYSTHCKDADGKESYSTHCIDADESKDFVGCYVDTHPARILPHLYVFEEPGGIDDSVVTDHHPEMENNRCLLYCKGQGFKYSGTQATESEITVSSLKTSSIWNIVSVYPEYKYQCYCGNGPFAGYNDIAAVSVDECNCKCVGDQSQICGCSWRTVVHETGYHIEDDTTSYSLVGNNIILTSDESKDLTTEKGSELRCARICSFSGSCRVFVVSKETGLCRLYNSYEVMCEGTQYAVGFQIYKMK